MLIMAISLIVFCSVVGIVTSIIAESFITLLGVTNVGIEFLIWLASFWFTFTGLSKIMIELDKSLKRR